MVTAPSETDHSPSEPQKFSLAPSRLKPPSQSYRQSDPNFRPFEQSASPDFGLGTGMHSLMVQAAAIPLHWPFSRQILSWEPEKSYPISQANRHFESNRFEFVQSRLPCFGAGSIGHKICEQIAGSPDQVVSGRQSRTRSPLVSLNPSLQIAVQDVPKFKSVPVHSRRPFAGASRAPQETRAHVGPGSDHLESDWQMVS